MAELWAGFRACEESDGTTVGASFDCELRSRSGCGTFLCATKNLPHPELVEGRKAELQSIACLERLPHTLFRGSGGLALAKASAPNTRRRGPGRSCGAVPRACAGTPRAHKCAVRRPAGSASRA